MTRHTIPSSSHWYKQEGQQYKCLYCATTGSMTASKQILQLLKCCYRWQYTSSGGRVAKAFVSSIMRHEATVAVAAAAEAMILYVA
jgi:hypothetical protein